jgi:hypothetical protein
MAQTDPEQKNRRLSVPQRGQQPEFERILRATSGASPLPNTLKGAILVPQ